MRKIMLGAILLFSIFTFGQTVEVNKKDINQYEYIEVYLAKHLFNLKESVFVNTGDNNFKETNRDATKNQRVIWDGEKLQKGNYFILRKFLIENGWKITDTRVSKIGEDQVTIHTFTK